jgi:drug/metabolite transporter (DMT)-like permease
MSFKDLARLIALAAIWGSSFLFMRILSPLLGPALTATARTLVAGLFLVVLFGAMRQKLSWRRHIGHYLVVGLLNSALPFLLFSWAALGIPASLSSVVNALTPLWGALFAALILGEALGGRKLVGMGLGLAGVALIAFRGGLPGMEAGGSILLPVLACVLATLCYGLAGAYIKRWASEVPPRAMTAASLLVAGLALLPLALLLPRPEAAVPASAWLLAIAYSLLCSALAYLLYFGLIASAGVARALSVTLLIPLFAFLWGLLFLGESISLTVLGGALLVLAGTGLITTGARRGAASGQR